jgi:hypothetical protein
MAEGLAEMGANLVICARKKERCQEAAEALRRHAVETLALGCDVKDRNAPDLLPDYEASVGSMLKVLRGITKRELLQLARLRDKNLLHVCHALVCDMFNESQRERLHEITTSTLWEEDGQEFYWDERREIAVQPSTTPTFKPDYAGAVEMLVKDKRLRDALSPRICRTLEMVFRKLAAGMDATQVIPAVAGDIRQDERTVRKHLYTSRKAANDLDSGTSTVMNILAGHVLPDNRTQAPPAPFRPLVDVLAETAALQPTYVY